jgi:DNA polymerase III epsilon subunit-like protein
MYIAIDTETGGLGDEVSLLTLYLGVLDPWFNLVGELDLCVKPNDGLYHIQPQSLTISKIDLVAHDAVAITYDQAATKIYEFLNSMNPGGKMKLIPIGHNVAFDIRLICQKTLSKKSWDKFVGYRCLDTGTISRFLMEANIMPLQNASLGDLASYFGVTFDAHTAKGDALASMEVMKHMIRLARKDD